ncbi:DegT/DnrJ/EryC1/StrS family aminotransferase [Algoriphagus aquimarinus]|uniref:dTDP-4-amino-4,6-dideoxygalactose transaminase n=1 Tax=Algoriphagus aquimarinus TaxID=237018 RepID=A0A1I0XDT9_9BACT|nr:DegT/DnrJ/EryC1/StrS family aminotransferase [Algoriphagus aquimarinus]SFA99054.1 dTDP-4-amino-4,6-dideoxygalactose transaminase [Algoriphagus aquimarinus]
MQIPFLDLKRMDEELKDALKSKFTEMLDQGNFSGGPEVNLFESQISNFLKSPFSIACANGTDALELALRALEIGVGDEVIVPAMTWVSTAEVVVMVGAKPVFWDTDEDGLLAENWEKAITSNTKAVIPVHLFGKMVDMVSLMETARKHNLFVIEDGAQSFGSFQNGQAAGTFGNIGCLSFYPTKNLGALGEAGMCMTTSARLNERMRLLLNHGQQVRDEHELVGRNSRIDSVQAGFLNVFFEKFELFQTQRKNFASMYLEGLSGIDGLQLPISILEENHNAHLFVIQTSRRDELKLFLREKGIGTALHYPNILPDMKPFQSAGNFSNARKLSNQGLSIPLNPWMKEQEIEYVVKAIQDFFT